MTKKKIVHVISSLKRGGAETVLVDLIESLPSFDHVVVYMHDGPIRAELEHRGVFCKQLQGTWRLYDPFTIIRLRNVLKKHAPDCVHSSLWAANFLTRLALLGLNVRHISAIHAHIHHQGRVRTLLDSITFWLGDITVAVSPGIYHALSGRWWVNTKKLVLIENGISFSRLQTKHAVDIPQILQHKQGLFVIGAVGRFIPAKNFPCLIEVFAQLHTIYPDMRLVLIGYGPEQDVLEELISSLNIKKSVMIIHGQQAAMYYPFFDCFVQPSRTEGLSIALLEAMSFGVPCVVTGDGKHDVVENHKTGLLVSHQDIAGLAQAIEYCYQERDAARILGNNARETVKRNFTSDCMAKKYQTIFSKNVSNCI